MRKQLFILVMVALLVASATAAPLNGSATGANSQTYLDNYYMLVQNALRPEFNTTQTWTASGVTYLGVPEFTSSTACGVGQLQAVYNTTAVSFSHYEIRTDAFSEAGIVLGGSNQSDAFDAWYNTLSVMDLCGYGSLPCWVVLKDGNNILPASANDTAIDGSVRSWTALYIASNNPEFTLANRTKYRTLADQMAADTLAYEFVSITPIATRQGYTVDKLPMGGGDCAGFGLGCSVDIWTGYLGAVALGFQYAYNNTGNATYDQVARNVTAAALSIAVQEDNDGDGFGVSPFNLNWDVTGPVLNHTDGGGVNSYHYTTNLQQWDDSDAPRFYEICHSLQVENATNGGSLRAPYTALSTYCGAWQDSGTVKAAQSCLQYGYNGTCGTTIRGGYYENGLGALVHTYHNISTLDNKIDETLTHYSWAGYTYDSTSCGTGLMYRGVRPTKALLYSIGLDVRITSLTAPSSPAPSTSTGTCTAGERALYTVIFMVFALGLVLLLLGGFSIDSLIIATLGAILLFVAFGTIC